jgi:hypothetical protein
LPFCVLFCVPPFALAPAASVGSVPAVLRYMGLWQQLRHESRMVALMATENFKNSDHAFVLLF